MKQNGIKIFIPAARDTVIFTVSQQRTLNWPESLPEPP